jgi:hypothetical protein
MEKIIFSHAAEWRFTDYKEGNKQNANAQRYNHRRNYFSTFFG